MARLLNQLTIKDLYFNQLLVTIVLLVTIATVTIWAHPWEARNNPGVANLRVTSSRNQKGYKRTKTWNEVARKKKRNVMLQKSIISKRVSGKSKTHIYEPKQIGYGYINGNVMIPCWESDWSRDSINSSIGFMVFTLKFKPNSGRHQENREASEDLR